MPELPFLLTALSGGTLLDAAAMMLAFFGFLFLGSMLLPGRRITGPDYDGKSRVYRSNGLACSC